MATIYSDELVRQRTGRNQPSSEWHGKTRVIEWTFASTPAGVAGDVLVLGRILKDERVLLGTEIHSASGAGTYNLGTYTIAADNISLGAVDLAARFIAGGANTVSVGPTLWPIVITSYNFVAPTDLFLCIQNVTTAFSTGQKWTGNCLVVGD